MGPPNVNTPKSARKKERTNLQFRRKVIAYEKNIGNIYEFNKGVLPLCSFSNVNFSLILTVYKPVYKKDQRIWNRRI